MATTDNTAITDARREVILAAQQVQIRIVAYAHGSDHTNMSDILICLANLEKARMQLEVAVGVRRA